MYIIDGYNLLWCMHKISEYSEDISQIELCRLIGRYLKNNSSKGQIIFDGIGPPDRGQFSNIDDIEVIFSGRNTDADGVIEAKIKADTAPKRLTVVSSDRRIRGAAKAGKAASIKSEQFCRTLLSKPATRAEASEPVQKKQGLDEGQTKQWLKYFGLDQ